MSTTELYVEYIVIGLETLCWVVLLFFAFIGKSMITPLKYFVANLFPTIVLIGGCYILGLVMDRISDGIFNERKKKIKERYEINSKTSLLVWEAYGQVTFAKFTLSRIRILRATIINCALIAVLGAYVAYKYYPSLKIEGLVLGLFLIMSFASNIAHRSLLHNYYSKTSILDSMIKTNKKKLKSKKAL